MKEIMFFDIDGTLLPEGNNKLSDSVVNAMQALKDNNIEICLCTGRNYWYAINIAKQANIGNLICGNGTEIYKNYECINSTTIPMNILEHIIENVEDKATMVAYMTTEGAYFTNKEHHDAGSLHFSGYGNVELHYTETLPKDTIKKLFICSTDKIQQDNMLNNLHHDLKAYCWSDTDCEVIPAQMSKAYGIKKFLETMTGEYKTYAFGDGVNDHEMLQFVDHPVVMENAKDKLKALIPNVAPSVFEDGIVTYLKQINKI